MIQKGKGRRRARGLAVLTAAPLLGVVPMLGAGDSATADGPVQVRERKAHKPGKARHKKRHKPGKAGKAAKPRVGTIALSTSGPGVPLLPGRTYNWPYAVTGKGPMKAAPATLVARLPQSLELVSGVQNCSFSAAPNSGAGGGTTGMTQATCELGPIKPGETKAGVLTTKVSEQAKPGERVTSTATVTWDKAQVTKAFPSTSVADTADVSVTKKGPAVVRPGETIPYTINVHNAGPSPAEHVTITSKAPAELVEHDTSCVTDAAVRAGSGSFVCRIDNLSAGETKTIHARVRPAEKTKPGTVLEAPSNVDSETADLNTANNVASVRTKIIRPGAVLASRPLVKVKKRRPGAGPNQRPAAPAERPARPGRPVTPTVPSTPTAPTRALGELPRTGAETGIMLDMSLGLVGTGLILARLGRSRRRRELER